MRGCCVDLSHEEEEERLLQSAHGDGNHASLARQDGRRRCIQHDHDVRKRGKDDSRCVCL